jgi:hypothetical protein
VGDQAEGWCFDWGDLQGEVAALGGMLGPVRFRLATAAWVEPFAVAPWGDDPAERLAALPPLLRRLRGEWPCLPFGAPEPRRDLPPDWMAGVDPCTPAADRWFHGFASNHPWHLEAREPEAITLAIDYPPDHPVRRLARRIARGPGPSLEVTLSIRMRRAAALPAGLHPVFAVSDRSGETVIEFPTLRKAANFPVAVEPSSVLAPGQVHPGLEGFRTLDGEVLDLSRHPLALPTEELVMVEPATGEALLCRHDAGFRLRLSWDIAVFPHCLMWISNRGRAEYPWSSRFRALGVEPVAAVFDLGQAHATNPRSPARRIFRNPGPLTLGAEGLTTTYRFEASALAGG